MHRGHRLTEDGVGLAVGELAADDIGSLRRGDGDRARGGVDAFGLDRDPGVVVGDELERPRWPSIVQPK